MTMKKPNATILTLFKLGQITGISVDYRQTGTDTAETYVTLTGGNASFTGKWGTVKDYLDVSVRVNEVARLDRRYQVQCEDWLAFVSREKKEFKEYERLKKKFG